MRVPRNNLAILEHKLGRMLSPDTKVTITVENLSKILDAVREEERDRPRPSPFFDAIDDLADSWVRGGQGRKRW